MRLLKHATFAVLATLALSSSAGMVSTSYVTIGEEGGLAYAQGSLRDARDSGDSQQYIGCSMDMRPNGDATIACKARDSAGNFLYCQANNDSHVGAVQMINSASYINFYATAEGECHAISPITGSDYLP